MANIPVPRSFSQIVSEMVDALLSRLGIPSLQVGSPALSIIEAAAQSDLRSSQDIFNLLNSLSLDRAEGIALDRIGQDENVPRLAASSAFGYVTISDTSFSKISSFLSPSYPAPILGSQTIYLDNTSGFGSGDTIYIGRGTKNYEGPLAIGTVSGNEVTLDDPTTRFHNIGESVIKAQGGTRTIAKGTKIKTADSNTGLAQIFSVQYEASIPDGDTSVVNVPVVADAPGVGGNVVGGSLVAFSSAPFVGAAVTNPAPFSSGRSTETDQTYRERIRAAKASRSKGTPLAIKTNAIGVVANDENKRVLSASIVSREGEPTALYIDDGTGYEEKTEGVAIEVIEENATGGEQYFSLSNGRPVAKAFLETSLSAPFVLVNDAVLAVEVGGVRTTHTFLDDAFNAISGASAYEVAAAINGNPELLWSARVSDNASKVSIFSKYDINEQIQVVSPDAGSIDANTYLSFPTYRADTLWLYKDDVLLTKDGQLATLLTRPQATWGSISSGNRLLIEVDGIKLYDSDGLEGIKIVDADFVDAGTNYLTVNRSNDLASWAAVFNYRLPGITVAISGGALSFTSNRGRTAESSLVITTDVSNTIGAALFDDIAAHGSDNDYSLDRNLGQIKLNSPLAASERLTAGSYYTRGFLTTGSFTTLTVPSPGATLWVSVDGNTDMVPVAIGPGSSLTFGVAVGNRTPVTCVGAFGNVLAGDWIVFTDTAINALNRFAFRVAEKASGDTIYIDPVATAETVSLTYGNVFVARTDSVPQKLTIPNTSYTPASLVTAINNQLQGATALTYRTTKVRLQTNSFGSGDICIVGWDENGEALGFPVGVPVASGPSHTASMASANAQGGTPSFLIRDVSGLSSNNQFSTPPNTDSTGSILQFIRTPPSTTNSSPTAPSLFRWGNDNFVSPITSISGSLVTTRSSVPKVFAADQQFVAQAPYAISPRDQLGIVIDGDTNSKRFVMNMYREAKPVDTTYSAVENLTETSGTALATAFGASFDWNDFAIHMKARTLLGGILWRYYRHGAEGNYAKVRYALPSAGDASHGISTITRSTTGDIETSISLASGSNRLDATHIRDTSWIGRRRVSGTGTIETWQYYFALDVTSIQRTTNVVTVILNVSGVTDHGLVPGDIVWIESTQVGFVTGPKVIVSTSLFPTPRFTYNDAGTDSGPHANPAVTVSRDVGGQVWFPPAVINGDVLSFSRIPVVGKITYPDSINGYSIVADVVGTATSAQTAISWTQVINTDNLQIFPLSGNTTAALVASINAITDTPVTGTEVTSGTITDATAFTSLVDGLNFVQSTTGAQFTFKNAVDVSLAGSGSDWQNEIVRLVPTTAKNVADWLNNSANGGLFQNADIATSAQGQRVQVSTETVGRDGSVEADGGSANALVASVIGGAVVSGTKAVVAVPASSINGLSGDSWVSFDNASTAPKTVWDATTTIALATDGKWTLTGPQSWTPRLAVASLANSFWSVRKCGSFVGYTWTHSDPYTNFSSVQEGDWVAIDLQKLDPTYSGGGTMLPSNRGIFRVVRTDIDTTTFWIENPNAIEEIASCKIGFFTFNSIMPGDRIVVGYTGLGAANRGAWTIERLDLADATNHNFYVDTTDKAPTAQTATTLSTNYTQVNVYESVPGRVIKKVLGIGPSVNGQADIQLSTNVAIGGLNSTYGTVMSCLDKLNFGSVDNINTTIVPGIDGYIHNTGLIEEVNRVIYGDEAQSTAYPGVAAAGAKININGPLIKRIQVSVAVRAKTGVELSAIADKVRSQVASIVNLSSVGESIAISDIVAAAQMVNGVNAVTILSPTYGSGNDLIAVQPYEKALVIDVANDVSVSFVGE